MIRFSAGSNGKALRLPRGPRHLAAGEVLYQAGDDGLAWRLEHGAIRLDLAGRDGLPAFASLAVGGDILGCETLLLGAYTFSACALTACHLSPWPEGVGTPATDTLLASLAGAQQRAAEIVALRGGQAVDRVLGLIRLLSAGGSQVVLPSRQDIAAITDLRFETITRIIKGLERERVLTPIRLDGVHATRSFALRAATA